MSDFADALATTSHAPETLGKIADLLRRSNIEPEDVGRVHSVALGTYQVVTKDAEGVATKHDLERRSVVLTPKWDEGPAWPVVQQAAPVKITAPPRRPKRTPALVRRWRTGVALPDPQIGFRWIDGALDPFHDEAAIDVALQVVASLENVRKLVNLGDYLDLQQQGRFVQEASFAQTTQPAIDYGHTFLALQRAAAPDAEIVVVEGNHDKRMQKFITLNAVSAFGLRRAQAPESWPVMSLPFLLRMDELGVKYIDAWPAGEYWFNDRLRAIHGNKVRSSGSTANAVVKDHPNIGTIMGHIHRIESHYRTIHDRFGPIRSATISPGCLCRVDGAVPSASGAVGVDGRPAVHWEDWQQGLAIIYYTEDAAADFRVETHQIIDGVALIGGQEFRAVGKGTPAPEPR